MAIWRWDGATGPVFSFGAKNGSERSTPTPPEPQAPDRAARPEAAPAQVRGATRRYPDRLLSAPPGLTRSPTIWNNASENEMCKSSRSGDYGFRRDGVGRSRNELTQDPKA